MCGGNFLEAAPLKLEKKVVRMLEIRMKDLKIEENNSFTLCASETCGHCLIARSQNIVSRRSCKDPDEVLSIGHRMFVFMS